MLLNHKKSIQFNVKDWIIYLGILHIHYLSFSLNSLIIFENNLEIQFNITHFLYHIVVKNAFCRFKNSFKTNNNSWNKLDENNNDDDDSDNDNKENNNIYNLSENPLKKARKLKRNQIITQLFQ
ncbi:hypothetical protein RhiirA1_476281 [Rhizophagus irregularis]|uniref:Uncharacterized protein n=1 Tax=Rhizophagus irregularis TaxID=588596 RepID=A0A2N0QVF1_9GLOM|nr:hypothetical protein RhiirA1_476281 [Rhizophagus irregularis]GET59771.1 hypothetical protein RIR_jg41442.t1 [Rhizophagus irregularis DAOM 181602=DAOM 197198]